MTDGCEARLVGAWMMMKDVQDGQMDGVAGALES